MRSNFFKNLTEQEIYNITDGISLTLHKIYLNELGLDWNTLDTDISNEILEIIDDCIEQMHEELKSRLESYDKDFLEDTPESTELTENIKEKQEE